MTKVSYCYPLHGNDVANLLSQTHRLPSSGEFNNPKSWIWEIRYNHQKGKFGQGKANFRIFPDKLVLVNATNTYAWCMVFTDEFAAKRKAIADSLAAKDAALTEKVLSFTGIALIETGHESWSYRYSSDQKTRFIVRFQNGQPTEILACDSYFFESSSGDRAYGLEPSSESIDFQYSYEEWKELVALHQPTLIIVSYTRDNGEYEQHTYTLNGDYVPSKACMELIKRV